MMKGMRRRYHRWRGRQNITAGMKLRGRAIGAKLRGHQLGSMWRDRSTDLVEKARGRDVLARRHYERALQLR